MADDSTSYKKPPRTSQFKKGMSGNPKGRPKRKPPAVGEIIDNVLNATAEYRERGQTKVATRRELTIRTHVNRALKGDVKSAETLLKLRAHAQGMVMPESKGLSWTTGCPIGLARQVNKKTTEFALKNQATLPDWWKQGSNDPTSKGS